MKRPAPMSLAGLDSEDDGAGNPLLFAIVDDHGQTWARERHVTLERLADRARERGGLEVWCTNLEYDLLNLFGMERLRELSLKFGKSYLCGAQWRGHKVHFRDTVRHVPIGVEALGELIGLKKREARLFDGAEKVTEAKLVRRCIRDTAITYQAARKLRELYAELGARPRLTLASSAYNVWFDLFWKREVRRPLHEHWAAAFEAYYGGRTEPFSIGEFEGVEACDASSMFPWAMTVAPLPLPWGRFHRVMPGETRIDPCGFYRVSVRSDLALPLLPFRSKSGLVFPNGSWSGWYVGCELIRFGKLGGKFVVREGFTFSERVRPFDSYIRTMFERKKRSQGARRLFYKLMLNSLYGKFGQRGERVVAKTLDQFTALDNPPAKFRVWAGMALYTENKNPPPWGNNIWPAIVTARARVRLHEEMTRLSGLGCRLLYCDTDGVLFVPGDKGRAYHPQSAAQAGDFETRGRYRVALIRAKKEYALQEMGGKWQFFAKGVPFVEREKYLRTGKAEFRRPVKMREAARSGAEPNVWRATRKERHVTFEHRGRRADGSLSPVRVGGENSSRRRK